MSRSKYGILLIVFLAVGFSQNGFVSAQTKKTTPKTSSSKVTTKKQEVKKESEKEEKLNTISEGKGIEGILVGRSTKKDVEKKFGTEYRWEKHKKYSNQMTYYRRGLSFYMCQSDPKQTIFVIEIRAPYKAKTSKGITLGKSTLEDIEKKYGKSKNGLEYRGINFYYNRIGNKKIVSNIDVVENAGIRQCKVNK